jgi:DNA-binding beta-propeller fold protein YncE
MRPQLEAKKGRFDMTRGSAPLRATLALAAGLALASATAPVAAQEGGYEIWAVDQGTGVVHIYGADLEEAARIDLAAEGVRTPHMIDFTSDHSHAVIASTGSGDVTIIRTEDREVVAVIPTGPATHMASVLPDDSAIIADVIGAGDVENDGMLVEITADFAAESFEVGRTLVIAEDPLIQERAEEFGDIGAVCHDYARDGRHAYVTLGPGLANGGLVILDTAEFKLVKAFSRDELNVNCGTLLVPGGAHMLVNGGSADVGVWYAIDTETLEVVKESQSGGNDAHGVWATPDGSEIWMVNRVSSNGIVIDAASLEQIAELNEVGKTPDIIAMSPDGARAFISLRGPNPVSAPHVAVGETPGFAVMDIAGRSLEQVIQPAEGNPDSDFHGIGVRVMQ